MVKRCELLREIAVKCFATFIVLLIGMGSSPAAYAQTEFAGRVTVLLSGEVTQYSNEGLRCVGTIEMPMDVSVSLGTSSGIWDFADVNTANFNLQFVDGTEDWRCNSGPKDLIGLDSIELTRNGSSVFGSIPLCCGQVVRFDGSVVSDGGGGELLTGSLTQVLFGGGMSGVGAVNLSGSTSTSCELDILEFRDSVILQAAGPTMLATFVPSNRCTLDEVAAAMGFDHFNWVQVITHYDGFLYAPGGIPINFFTPFLDPPDGGYISPWHPADSLPYYWDEVYGWPLDPEYHIDNFTPSPNILTFQDTPRSVSINKPGEYMGFTTSLVGVVRGSVWVPEYTFTWKSNYNGQFGGTSGRDISPPQGGTGSVFDVQVLQDPLNVSPNVRDVWADNGGFEEVPQEIEIDVKPGSESNCLNINGKGVVPVAILGSALFDVTLIDLGSLVFGGLSSRMNGKGHPLCSTGNINDDNFSDLVCKFEDDKDQWVARDNVAILRGELFDGSGFVGTDSICRVPKQKGKKQKGKKQKKK